MTLAKRASTWVRNTFGEDCAADRQERAARVVEEAIELGQAENLSQEFVQLILRRVFSRPPGNPNQEAAGTGFCLLAWAEASHQDLDALIDAEISRVEKLPPEPFRAKHHEKKAAGTVIIASKDHDG